MGTALSLTWPQALAWRLERHLLDPLGSASAAEVVRRLGAVPAMDKGLAELAVRVRQNESIPGGLAAAVTEGTVITVFAFRGAVHHLSAEDGGAILALRAAGRQWERSSWVDHYGLSAEAWPDFRAAVREVLSVGPLTVAELGARVTHHAPYRHLADEFARGADTLIRPLTWQGDMSFGPSRDGRSTFQRLDTNPHWTGIPALEEAGPLAITRHLRTYGPATSDNLRHWFVDGLSAGRARLDRWLTELGDRLVTVDVEGDSAYVLAEDVDSLEGARPSDSVRFLPGHDQWVMGPGTKDRHVTPEAHRDLVTRKANLIIVGGVVRGIWTAKGGQITITWLDEPPPAEAIEQEAARATDVLTSSNPTNPSASKYPTS